jgi:transcriptional regulator with XRE-family HTH domain
LTYGQNRAFIGFYSKRRKTTMQVIHLSQKELAERWRMSEATLERWRSDRIGPVFLKILGRVLYRLIDIEAFEVASLKGTFVEHRYQVASTVSSNSVLTKGAAENNCISNFI